MKFKFQNYLSTEAVIWSVALLSLTFFYPDKGSHFSLCLFKNAGLPFCPGCGLGHAISYFLHGEIESSFAAHPMGIPAVGILIYRIITLTKKQLTRYTYEESN